MDLNALYADLAAGLPRDVQRLMEAGDLEAAKLCADVHRADDTQPECTHRALLAARHIMDLLPAEYPLGYDALLAALQAEMPDFAAAELDSMMYCGGLDWRYIAGRPCFPRRTVESLRLYPSMNARGLRPDAPADNAFRDKLLAAMRERGAVEAAITLKASIAPKAELRVKPDALCRAWLPIPAAAPQQSGIEILSATAGAQIAPETAPQRTAYWQAPAGSGPFSVTYRYHIRAEYRNLYEETYADAEQPLLREYLQEQAPHMRFTPYLRELCAGITDGCADALQKARAIYDYITANTNYRYQAAYAVQWPIAENCARSHMGDCGIMALLFVTLCRIAGIPAQWQSGLYVRPDRASCHDWAMFYIAPYGWLWADCSFGSSAHRAGSEERRRYYFGNLDPLRMVANREFYAQLTPPDEDWRSDPYDNQIGELSVEGIGLVEQQLEHSVEVLAFEMEL